MAERVVGEDPKVRMDRVVRNARQLERDDVVAWLRGLEERQTGFRNGERRDYLRMLQREIAGGSHLGKAGER